MKSSDGVDKMQASGARIAKRAKEMSEAKDAAKAETAEGFNSLWSQLKEEVKKDLAKAK